MYHLLDEWMEKAETKEYGENDFKPLSHRNNPFDFDGDLEMNVNEVRLINFKKSLTVCLQREMDSIVVYVRENEMKSLTKIIIIVFVQEKSKRHFKSEKESSIGDILARMTQRNQRRNRHFLSLPLSHLNPQQSQ